MIKKIGSAFFLILVAYLAYHFTLRYYIGEAREDAIDFPSYYYAAKLSFQLKTSPYTNTSWNIVKEEYKNAVNEGPLYPFLYPPPSLPFFGLFTLLEYEPAKLLMLGLNHALVLAFVFLFFFKVIDLHTYNLLPMAGAYYLYHFFPLILTIYTGQINFVILILILLTWLGVKEKWHPALTAIPLVLGIILKLYPALFFIVLFLRKEYKTIGYSLAYLVLISIVSTPFLPYGTWGDWVTNVASKGYLEDVRGVITGRPGNQSINALLIRTFYGMNIRFSPIFTPASWIIHLSPYVLCGLIGLLSLIATWKTRDWDNALELQFSIWLLAMFMVAPISWDHHLVLILPAIYISFLEAIRRKWYLWLIPLAGIAYFLALNFNFNDPAYREGWLTLLISAKLYAVMVLWIFFMALAFFKKSTTKPIEVAQTTSVREQITVTP